MVEMLLAKQFHKMHETGYQAVWSSIYFHTESGTYLVQSGVRERLPREHIHGSCSGGV